MEQDLFTKIISKKFNVECVKEYRFDTKRRWRFDYAIPDFKIALEVEGGVWSGGKHIRAKGFLGDMEKYNRATLLGWRVYRCTPQNLYTEDTFNLLKFSMFPKPSEEPIC